MHFLKRKFINFNYNFTEVCSHGSNQQYSSTGSDNGLAPERQQAIIWTNDGLLYWHVYALLGLNELMGTQHMHRCICVVCLNTTTRWENTMWINLHGSVWSFHTMMPEYQHGCVNIEIVLYLLINKNLVDTFLKLPEKLAGCLVSYWNCRLGSNIL